MRNARCPSPAVSYVTSGRALQISINRSRRRVDSPSCFAERVMSWLFYEVERIMSSFWDKQIERADYLAAESSGSKELLTFYAQLLRAQKEIYEAFRGRTHWLPSGDLETDVAVVQASMSG